MFETDIPIIITYRHSVSLKHCDAQSSRLSTPIEAFFTMLWLIWGATASIKGPTLLSKHSPFLIQHLGYNPPLLRDINANNENKPNGEAMIVLLYVRPEENNKLILLSIFKKKHYINSSVNISAFSFYMFHANVPLTP